jgi:cystathionine gamma-synthase/methionine-gamma-lyase
MLSFGIHAEPDVINRFVNSLKIIISAVSLGHDESLIVFIGPNDERIDFYPPQFRTRGFLRFSVGLESADDLIADLTQAFKQAGL